jgi:acetoin:2,6-dichlorophenolindophenol oxidoreductase subunit beta
VSTRITLSQAFQQGVREEMERDEAIFVLGTDMVERGGHFAQLRGIGTEFPGRVRDAPISEAAMVAAGVGAALNGLRPIVDLNFIDFALGAMDEIVNQAAKARFMWGRGVPMVIRGTAGIAFYAAQHNNSLEAGFAHTPGLLVVMPSTPADTKGLIKSALRCGDPVVFLMHKSLTGLRGEVPEGEHVVPLGEAAIRRAGDDVTLVAYGALVARAERVAERLGAEGIAVEVIDLRTLFPLDLATIEASVRRTGRLVVASEAPRHGGIGGEIAAAIQESSFFYLDAPIQRVGALHTPISHSPPLIAAAIPSEEQLERAIRATLTPQEAAA